MDGKFLRRPEAAKYCRERGVPCAATTLQKYVTTGGGPVYRKFGRIPLYLPADLDMWIAERLSGPRRSSSGRTAEISAASEG